MNVNRAKLMEYVGDVLTVLFKPEVLVPAMQEFQETNPAAHAEIIAAFSSVMPKPPKEKVTLVSFWWTEELAIEWAKEMYEEWKVVSKKYKQTLEDTDKEGQTRYALLTDLPCSVKELQAFLSEHSEDTAFILSRKYWNEDNLIKLHNFAIIA